MRVVVLLGLVGLVLPGIVTTISLGAHTAQASCEKVVSILVPSAKGASARFEIFGDGFIGWECYSVGAFGGDQHVLSLGLIASRR